MGHGAHPGEQVIESSPIAVAGKDRQVPELDPIVDAGWTRLPTRVCALGRRRELGVQPRVEGFGDLGRCPVRVGSPASNGRFRGTDRDSLGGTNTNEETVSDKLFLHCALGSRDGKCALGDPIGHSFDE
ncbi:hypothetical protein AB0H36_32725 [Kribbella sp. NPDC050820]|uniref:hypothetical protein n=1 Tax=Kribbella sp. NPDC050820 TaxID=3155408 RepID=UPI0033FF08C6